MGALLRRIRSRYLAALVAVTDVLLWTAVVPFELYARTAIVQRHADTIFLLSILLANITLLLLIASAAAALAELMRRGLNRPLRAILRLRR
jgi:hypothetical protein